MEPNDQNQPEPAPAATGIKQQIAEQIKAAGNIVVTTSKKPALDEVAAVVGLTQLLHAMGKHTTGVISTTLPKATEFLNPRAVIQADTKRLQDFVISLHKDKVDKLRYKLDGDQVKVFMTPYKTVLSEKDLSFSQGDYNIDTVIALGVVNRNEIDDAMLASPRILADPQVITINAGDAVGTLGSLNWNESTAVSVTEMVASLSDELGSGLLKADSSQSLLTGLVAVTDQFGNQLTTPKVMTMAAQLMAAGADQQFIVRNLKEANALKIVKEDTPKEDSPPSDEPQEKTEAPSKKAQAKTNTEKNTTPEDKPAEAKKDEEPTQTISEIEQTVAADSATDSTPSTEQPKKEPQQEPKAEPHVDVHPELPTLKKPEPVKEEAQPVAAKPETPNEDLEAARKAVEEAEVAAAAQEEPSAWGTEKSPLDTARTAVKQAADSQEPKNPEPVQALNAQNMNNDDSNDIVINHDGEIELPQ